MTVPNEVLKTDIENEQNEQNEAAASKLCEGGAPAENAAAELKGELEALRGELEKLHAELAGMGKAASRIDAPPVTAGKVGGGGGELLFSPAEVRAMSRAEVRDNLDRIRESMRNW